MGRGVCFTRRWVIERMCGMRTRRPTSNVRIRRRLRWPTRSTFLAVSSGRLVWKRVTRRLKQNDDGRAAGFAQAGLQRNGDGRAPVSLAYFVCMNESENTNSELNRRDFLKGSSFAAMMAMMGGVQLMAQPAATGTDLVKTVKPVKVALIGLGPW